MLRKVKTQKGTVWGKERLAAGEGPDREDGRLPGAPHPSPVTRRARLRVFRGPGGREQGGRNTGGAALMGRSWSFSTPSSWTADAPLLKAVSVGAQLCPQSLVPRVCRGRDFGSGAAEGPVPSSACAQLQDQGSWSAVSEDNSVPPSTA